jgi:hypothetical protein
MAELIDTACGDAILVRCTETTEEHLIFLAETHCDDCRRAAGRIVPGEVQQAKEAARLAQFE